MWRTLLRELEILKKKLISVSENNRNKIKLNKTFLCNMFLIYHLFIYLPILGMGKLNGGNGLQVFC